MQRYSIAVTALASFTLVLAILSTAFLRKGITSDGPALTFTALEADARSSAPYQDGAKNGIGSSKVAFATFLSAFNASYLNPQGGDGYFDSARLINYQLLHHPSTRNTSPIPLIVLVSPDVSKLKRKQLEHEGATVVEGEDLTPLWLKKLMVGDSARWHDVMIKMNIASMTEFEKICYIDADTLIHDRIDGVFDDPATEIVPIGTIASEFDEKEAPLPEQYMFAAMLDRRRTQHPIPPKEKDWDEKGINAGFFCLHPSQAIFEHYLSVMGREDKYFASFPEQNMLNVIHRRHGNMPFARLHWNWNTNHPSPRDMAAGVKSFHGKLWLRDDEIASETQFDEFYDLWWQQKHEMDRFYALPKYRNSI